MKDVDCKKSCMEMQNLSNYFGYYIKKKKEN